MEHQKILNLLNEACDSTFVTRNWNIVNDRSNTCYSLGSKIIYGTEMLTSNFCDYNYAYILLRADITIIGHNVTQAAFRNFAPFIKYITKSDETSVDDAEDLDFVMPMRNLLENSSNYSDTTGSL